jgi:dephospho-CoA kinase
MELIKEWGGKTIRVNNPRIKSTENEHISETALDNYEGFDYIITNDGTLEDLKEKIKRLEL